MCAAACMTALQAQTINKEGGLTMQQINMYLEYDVELLNKSING